MQFHSLDHPSVLLLDQFQFRNNGFFCFAAVAMEMESAVETVLAATTAVS